ncbi:MAG: hypothetical protein MOB07_14050 [Acidobacteria bacterium]|nr:hypothetical protein [Acidobacteriota bacterium]
MTKRSLQVEVTEATADETRTINVTITGATEDFLLADLLTKRKAIQPIATALKQAAQEAVKAYLESAEGVITGVKSEQQKDAPAAKESTTKRIRKGKEKEPAEDTLLANLAAKTVNGAATTDAIS